MEDAEKPRKRRETGKEINTSFDFPESVAAESQSSVVGPDRHGAGQGGARQAGRGNGELPAPTRKRAVANYGAGFAFWWVERGGLLAADGFSSSFARPAPTPLGAGGKLATHFHLGVTVWLLASAPSSSRAALDVALLAERRSHRCAFPQRRVRIG